MQRALFSQFSCAFKALQAKEQVQMQKLTQGEVLVDVERIGRLKLPNV